MALIVLALLPLSHGSQLFSQQSAFNREAISARATVIMHARDPAQQSVSATDAVFSIVEFTDDEGSRRKAQTNVSSYPPQHAIGDDIDIRYHQSRHDDVREASFVGIWLESTFYLLPGVLTLAGGLLLVFKGRKP